jgi:hypothetical protein
MPTLLDPLLKKDLEHRIAIEWYKFTEKIYLKYIGSMPARNRVIIKSKGGPTTNY